MSGMIGATELLHAPSVQDSISYLLGGGPPPIGGHGTADASGHGRDDPDGPDERTPLLPHLEGSSGDRGRVKRKPSAGGLWLSLQIEFTMHVCQLCIVLH